MILVDTSAWIHYLRGADHAVVARVRRALASDEVVLGDLVLVEVLQGIRRDQDVVTTAALLRQRRVENLCGIAIAEQAAANYRFLRQRGITIRGTIDVIIATWCLVNEAEIIHDDRDLAAMEAHLGLRAFR